MKKSLLTFSMFASLIMLTGCLKGCRKEETQNQPTSSQEAPKAENEHTPAEAQQHAEAQEEYTTPQENQTSEDQGEERSEGNQASEELLGYGGAENMMEEENPSAQYQYI